MAGNRPNHSPVDEAVDQVVQAVLGAALGALLLWITDHWSGWSWSSQLLAVLAAAAGIAVLALYYFRKWVPISWWSAVAVVVVLAAAASSFVVLNDDNVERADGCQRNPPPNAIEVMVVWDLPEELNAFCEIVATYDEDVAVNSVGPAIGEALVEAIAAGDPPDVAIIPQPSLVRFLGARCGDLVALDDLPAVENPEDGIPTSWTQVVTERPPEGGQEHAWGAFVKGSAKSMFWYLDAELEGEPSPRGGDGWEWEYFRDDWLPRYIESGIDGTRPAPLTLAAQDRWPLTDWFENQLALMDAVRRPGGSDSGLYQRLVEGELGSIQWEPGSPDHTTLHDTLWEMAQVWGRPGVFPAGELLPTTTRQPQLDDRLEEEDTALVFHPSFLASQVDELYRDGAVRAFRFPGLPSRDLAVVGGDVAVVPEQDDSSAGRLLVTWLTRESTMTTWSEADPGYIVPNWSSRHAARPQPGDTDVRQWLTHYHLLTSVTPGPDDQVLFDLSDDQFAVGRDERGQVVYDDRTTWEIFRRFFDDITQRSASPETAITRAINALEAEYTEAPLGPEDCP